MPKDWLPLQMPNFDISPGFDYSRMEELQDSVRRSVQERIAREQTIATAAELSMNAAYNTVEALIDQIDAFQAKLDADEEVSVFVIGGPSGQSFFPTTLQPINPDKIIFGGDSDGRPFVVVQHVSQLNFALRAVKVGPEDEPRRIGFHHPEEG